VCLDDLAEPEDPDRLGPVLAGFGLAIRPASGISASGKSSVPSTDALP
jgi:hypothetical protein